MKTACVCVCVSVKGATKKIVMNVQNVFIMHDTVTRKFGFSFVFFCFT